MRRREGRGARAPSRVEIAVPSFSLKLMNAGYARSAAITRALVLSSPCFRATPTQRERRWNHRNHRAAIAMQQPQSRGAKCKSSGGGESPRREGRFDTVGSAPLWSVVTRQPRARPCQKASAIDCGSAALVRSRHFGSDQDSTSITSSRSAAPSSCGGGGGGASAGFSALKQLRCSTSQRAIVNRGAGDRNEYTEPKRLSADLSRHGTMC